MKNWQLLTRRCWIFDLDGTLTRPQHDFAAIKKALDVPEHCYILEHLETLEPHVRREKRVQLDQIEAEIASRSERSYGAKELVEALLARCCQIGILTRNSRDNALVSLAQIGLAEHFPGTVILGRDEAAPKPDPAGVNLLLDAWQARPNEAVFVGDYIVDLQTAQAAGVGAIHFDRKGNFLWPQHTDLGVSCLTELILEA